MHWRILPDTCHLCEAAKYRRSRWDTSPMAILSGLCIASGRAHHARMTKEKFTKLCETVLLPKLSDAMHDQLGDIHATLDAMSQELIRVGERLDDIDTYLDRHKDCEDHAS
jgi:hypothetical protein